MSGSTCETDGEMIFSSAVSNLTFDIDGATAGSDTVEISAFNGVAFLASFVFDSGDQFVDAFAGLGEIIRLFFDDSSSAAGVGYSTFNFNAGVDGQVPLPAALPLLAAGLGVFGLIGWRRNRAPS